MAGWKAQGAFAFPGARNPFRYTSSVSQGRTPDLVLSRSRIADYRWW